MVYVLCPIILISLHNISILLSPHYILSKKWLVLYGFERRSDTNTNNNTKHKNILQISDTTITSNK